MDDLVRRQDVLDALKKIGLGLAEVTITLLPSARKKGEWLEKERIEEKLKWADGLQSAKCSVCGRYHTTPYMYSFTDFNFCPHCGADMREER